MIDTLGNWETLCIVRIVMKRLLMERGDEGF
jgi:hypothetical protein